MTRVRRLQKGYPTNFCEWSYEFGKRIKCPGHETLTEFERGFRQATYDLEKFTFTLEQLEAAWAHVGEDDFYDLGYISALTVAKERGLKQ